MPLPCRFDDALMAPPDAIETLDAALLLRLRDWCSGEEGLRAAHLAPRPGLDAAARVLDGSDELARLGRWRGLLWRLAIVVQERLPRRGQASGIPWDCGWWRGGPLGVAEAFRPRRATLLMVREADAARAPALLAAMQAACGGYQRPVRLLVVSEAALPGIATLGPR